MWLAFFTAFYSAFCFSYNRVLLDDILDKNFKSQSFKFKFTTISFYILSPLSAPAFIIAEYLEL